jgi:hypothetical protein
VTFAAKVEPRFQLIVGDAMPQRGSQKSDRGKNVTDLID